ncbi:hypothetical protein RDV89_03825 [Nocardioides zeae]|uniref:Uncharacterized protein n=1 Tax=Nocardioides imazamoxiresistens TaxID=3231893 RepID=A0ABU3PSF7_9ACTN|nr:hypothetical protein [Nocardioides zeae]MDT9592179.1 hypothetical protein [Nocardioides zeae]
MGLDLGKADRRILRELGSRRTARQGQFAELLRAHGGNDRRVLSPEDVAVSTALVVWFSADATGSPIPSAESRYR